MHPAKTRTAFPTHSLGNYDGWAHNFTT